MAKCPAHRDDLALMMKGVSEDMMEDERWSAMRAFAVRKVQFIVGVQAFVGESGKELKCPVPDLPLKANSAGYSGKVGGIAINVCLPLENAHPEPLTVEDVHDLAVNGVETEAVQLSLASLSRERCQVIKQE